MNSVAMLGEGAWGSSVATVLAHNGVAVDMWCHDPQVEDDIAVTRCNTRYLPDIQLAGAIKPSTDLRAVINDVEIIFVAIPVQYVRSVLQLVQTVYSHQKFVVLCKGIEQSTHLFPSQIIREMFGTSVKSALVMGPSFAKDVANKQLTGVEIASEHGEFAREVRDLLDNDYFKTFYNQDVVGVEVGAALKNILALTIGMLDGAGYTDNTKAFIFTKMYEHMVAFAQVLGANKETLYGLSGLGDAVMTTYGGLSRNMRVGQQLGAGKNLTTILDETGYTPEGVNTVRALRGLSCNVGFKVPLLNCVEDVIDGKKTVQDLLTCV